MPRFSETLMDHFTAPRNTGTLEHPDRVGTAGTLGQGPFLALHVRLDGDRVAEARFQTYGCGVSIAAGSLLTELIEGRTVAEALEVTPEALDEAMDGFPPDKAHCPVLAIAALRAALAGDDPAA